MSPIVLLLGLFADPGAAAPAVDLNAAVVKLDTAVAAGWKNEQAIRPASRCDDATFLRRVWLDLAGRVPPFVDADRLSKSNQPLDRAAVVDKLLASPEFASYWSLKWAEYLLGQRPFDTAEFSGRKLQQFLRESIKSHRHYDQIVADLISAEGAMDEAGAVNFLLRYNADPNPLAGAVSQKFLGVSLQCAECHDHPQAAWKQTDFWGLSAFFARLRRMTPSNPAPNEQFVAVLERPRGELLVIDKKAKPDDQGNFPTRTVIPQFPGTGKREISTSRRTSLARWITDAENPYFARHAVNQTWTQLMGSPLVATLDPAGTSTKTAERSTEATASPTNANTQILEQLRADFVDSGFDLHRLICVIVLSDTYQRSGPDAVDPDQVTAERRRDMNRAQELFATSRTRPLSADQIHLSVGQAFSFFSDDGDRRLAQLTGEEFTYDVPVGSFGPQSQSLGRSLALFNGEHIRGAVDVAAQSLLRIHGDAAGPEHIRHLFVCLLSRLPSNEELDQFLDLAGDDVPQRGLEDAAWVILNSAEFQTNH